MRITRAVALLLPAVLLAACDARNGAAGPDPAALLQPLVGLYRLSMVEDLAIPAELEPEGALCEEREPFRNGAGARVDGEIRAMFFDGTLEVRGAGHAGYALSLSVRTRCTFGDGGHQELEDQWQEEGGLELEEPAPPSFQLRRPLVSHEGYTHLETGEPVLRAEGEVLRLSVRVNGAPLTLTFRRIL
ncbi:MAG TPA: hypothetical protein VMK65_07355 [Longimicrobiales bacterium]|nr:hypothetical protein [Longimicrobiales bacterium]